MLNLSRWFNLFRLVLIGKFASLALLVNPVGIGGSFFLVHCELGLDFTHNSRIYNLNSCLMQQSNNTYQRVLAWRYKLMISLLLRLEAV